MITFLDFEKPIAELEGKIRELRQLAMGEEPVDVDDEVGRLEGKLDKMLRDTYGKLGPWQKTQVARHPERPHFKDYIENKRSPQAIVAPILLDANDQMLISQVELQQKL